MFWIWIRIVCERQFIRENFKFKMYIEKNKTDEKFYIMVRTENDT